MKPETILRKAIERAVKGGYKGYGFEKMNLDDLLDDTEEGGWFQVFFDSGNHYALIFSHDFAEAFFPKREPRPECNCDAVPSESHKETCAYMICSHCGLSVRIRGNKDKCDHLYYPDSCEVCKKKTQNWQYHQHKMLDEVQEGKDPLKYLEKFL